MYFDFEDHRPDIAPLGRAISWREGFLLSVIAHLAALVTILLSPELFRTIDTSAPLLALQPRPQDRTTFVFVQPRVDRTAPKPPERGEFSDKDRRARAPERVPNPTNALPFSRGNTPERVVEPPPSAARGPAPDPAPAADPQAQAPSRSAAEPALKVPEAQSALQLPPIGQTASTAGASSRAAGARGSLGDTLRNLQRYVQTFENPQGGGGEFGPEIQFDTKGVEFGPWIRRFVTQVKRNWYVPNAAMYLKGHVVITFNVHKNGAITDLAVIGPCPIEAFNIAAYGALVASNPTQPLPPEYPADKAFFTVTFLYNETPQ